MGETKNGNDEVLMRSYNPSGRLVSQTNAISVVSLIACSATNVTSRGDPAENTTLYRYDAAGRRTSQVDALSARWPAGPP